MLQNCSANWQEENFTVPKKNRKTQRKSSTCSNLLVLHIYFNAVKM